MYMHGNWTSQHSAVQQYLKYLFCKYYNDYLKKKSDLLLPFQKQERRLRCLKGPTKFHTRIKHQNKELNLYLQRPKATSQPLESYFQVTSNVGPFFTFLFLPFFVTVTIKLNLNLDIKWSAALLPLLRISCQIEDQDSKL